MGIVLLTVVAGVVVADLPPQRVWSLFAQLVIDVFVKIMIIMKMV